MKAIEAIDQTATVKAVGLAAALGLLWSVLAWRFNPTTFHFGALLVAAVIPYGYVTTARPAPPPPHVAAMTAAGVVPAPAVTTLLSSVGKPEGLSLLPFGGAATEAIIFSFADGAIGMLAAVQSTKT